MCSGQITTSPSSRGAGRRRRRRRRGTTARRSGPCLPRCSRVERGDPLRRRRTSTATWPSSIPGGRERRARTAARPRSARQRVAEHLDLEHGSRRPAAAVRRPQLAAPGAPRARRRPRRSAARACGARRPRRRSARTRCRRRPSRMSPTTTSPDFCSRGRSICVMSPVTTIFEPKPSRVRNIFICSGDVFCASSRITNESLSVRPRMNASGATSITPALEVRGDALGVDHVVQRVEQRAQVRVDLRHQVAGQEAEPLAGLDGRAREDDAVDLAARRARRWPSRSARNVLPVPAGPMPNVIVFAPDRVDVALLVDRLRRDLEVAVAPDDVLEHLGRRLVLVEHARSPTSIVAGPISCPRSTSSDSSRTTVAAACTASASPSSVTTLPRRKTSAVERAPRARAGSRPARRPARPRPRWRARAAVAPSSRAPPSPCVGHALAVGAAAGRAPSRA